MLWAAMGTGGGDGVKADMTDVLAFFVSGDGIGDSNNDGGRHYLSIGPHQQGGVGLLTEVALSVLLNGTTSSLSDLLSYGLTTAAAAETG